MPDVAERAPWAYVAHKGGYWCGVASASLPRKELAKFLGEFAAEGFTLTTVFDRDEYEALLSGLQAWGERPPSPLPLFEQAPP